MIPRGAALLLLALAAHAQLIFPSSVSRKPRLNSNTIAELDTACSRDSMDVRVRMERPFKGVVFAKDFSRECRAQGNMDAAITLRLSPNACGVRVGAQPGGNDSAPYDEGLFLAVTVVVQMDRHLQQSSDEEREVRCWLRPRALRIRSYVIEEMLEKNYKEVLRKEKATHRSGRMGSEWKDISPEQQVAIMERARAWMEILPAAGDLRDGTVEVGEPTTLLIKSTLPAGVGLRITDCLAHDGLGESSQKLLDEVGCPVDELIFPRMKMFNHTPILDPDMNILSSESQEEGQERDAFSQNSNEQSDVLKYIMSYQHASTIFSAFKFPDRARLHLTCGLELCKGDCAKVDCRQHELLPKSKDALLRRTRLDKEADGIVIERLQVYNSIEVLAPNIELENDASIRGSRQSNGLNGVDLNGYLSTSPGDKTVCMSPSKMALAFCVLGLVFLSALVVAFISLIRARRKYGGDRFGSPLSLYTGSKSLFSGSGSSNSGFSGSKLLLTDSPYLDHQSTSSNWPYGRHGDMVYST